MLLKNIFAVSSQVNFFANSRQSFLSTFKALCAETLRSLSKQSILDPSNISLGPGTGYAATGVPQFKASVTTIPNVSVLLGHTKTSEDAKLSYLNLWNISSFYS